MSKIEAGTGRTLPSTLEANLEDGVREQNAMKRKILNSNVRRYFDKLLCSNLSKYLLRLALKALQSLQRGFTATTRAGSDHVHMQMQRRFPLDAT
jgi:hypothetical protein